MRVLMFTWEFPPFISGGLGTACHGIVTSLLKQGVEVDLVLPTTEDIYFPLRKVEDTDTMPARFLEPKEQQVFERQTFKTVKEKLEYIGVHPFPESYTTPALELKAIWTKMIEEHATESIRSIVENVDIHLDGHEDIFKKVREMNLKAAKFAKALEYDLIHAHDWLTAAAGITAKAVSGKPLIFHIHATEFDRAGGPGDDRIHKLEYSGMSMADTVIAVSNYTAEMVINRYRIDTGKIRVVHNALDVETYKKVQRPKRLFKNPVVLFLGRITLQKGPDYFLDVAKRVLDKYPNVHFIMAGAGDMMRKMIHTSAYHKLRNRFLFTGFLNKKQVGKVFKSSDIFIMPSISEPFGIVPLEAMGYGVVSVISKQSGVAEILKNAFVVDFWDIEEMVNTICHLLENPDKRKRISEAGRKEVINIQWDRAVAKIIEVYRETAYA